VKCAILALTMGREELTLRLFKENMKKAGYPFELLLTDQGVACGDPKYAVQLLELKPSYHRFNQCNEGVARSLNQMILRSKADLFFFMPNDFELPQDWLKTMVETVEVVEKSGIIGFLGQDLILPKMYVNGKTVYSGHDQPGLEESLVLGAIGFTRTLINTIGYFCEEYHPFGWEDADFCFRAKIAGFFNYLVDAESNHMGVGEHNSETYHLIKRFMATSNIGLHRWRAMNYAKVGVYCPPPIMKPTL
jgi:Glycosyl transferase family 2